MTLLRLATLLVLTYIATAMSAAAVAQGPDQPQQCTNSTASPINTQVESVQSSSPEQSAKEVKMTRQREAVMSEIRSTEHTYINNLSLLMSTFQEPLEQLAQELDRDDVTDAIHQIFSNIRQIHQFHVIIANKFDTCKTPKDFADSLVLFSDFFKIYTTYINGYDRSLDSISLLRSIKKCNILLEKGRNTLGGRDIMTLLITPVQRIPRYELLLRELLRYTRPDSKERDSNSSSESSVDISVTALDLALSKIKSVAIHINEGKRRAESRSLLLEALSGLNGLESVVEAKGTMIEPHRRVIVEGAVWEVDGGNISYVPENNGSDAGVIHLGNTDMNNGNSLNGKINIFGGKKKPRYLLLLNDSLLWASNDGGKFHHLGQQPTNGNNAGNYNGKKNQVKGAIKLDDCEVLLEDGTVWSIYNDNNIYYHHQSLNERKNEIPSTGNSEATTTITTTSKPRSVLESKHVVFRWPILHSNSGANVISDIDSGVERSAPIKCNVKKGKTNLLTIDLENTLINTTSQGMKENCDAPEPSSSPNPSSTQCIDGCTPLNILDIPTVSGQWIQALYDTIEELRLVRIDLQSRRKQTLANHAKSPDLSTTTTTSGVSPPTVPALSPPASATLPSTEQARASVSESPTPSTVAVATAVTNSDITSITTPSVASSPPPPPVPMRHRRSLSRQSTGTDAQITTSPGTGRRQSTTANGRRLSTTVSSTMTTDNGKPTNDSPTASTPKQSSTTAASQRRGSTRPLHKRTMSQLSNTPKSSPKARKSSIGSASSSVASALSPSTSSPSTSSPLELVVNENEPCINENETGIVKPTSNNPLDPTETETKVASVESTSSDALATSNTDMNVMPQSEKPTLASSGNVPESTEIPKHDTLLTTPSVTVASIDANRRSSMGVTRDNSALTRPASGTHKRAISALTTTSPSSKTSDGLGKSSDNTNQIKKRASIAIVPSATSTSSSSTTTITPNLKQSITTGSTSSNPTNATLVAPSMVNLASSDIKTLVHTAVSSLSSITRMDITFLKQVSRATRAPPRLILILEALAVVLNYPAPSPSNASSSSSQGSTVPSLTISALSSALNPTSSSSYTLSPSLDPIPIPPTFTPSSTLISMLNSPQFMIHVNAFASSLLSAVDGGSLPLSALSSSSDSSSASTSTILCHDMPRLNTLLSCPHLAFLLALPSRKAVLAMLGDSRATLGLFALIIAAHAAQHDKSFQFPTHLFLAKDKVDHPASSTTNASSASSSSSSSSTTTTTTATTTITPTTNFLQKPKTNLSISTSPRASIKGQLTNPSTPRQSTRASFSSPATPSTPSSLSIPTTPSSRIPRPSSASSLSRTTQPHTPRPSTASPSTPRSTPSSTSPLPPITITSTRTPVRPSSSIIASLSPSPVTKRLPPPPSRSPPPPPSASATNVSTTSSTPASESRPTRPPPPTVTPQRPASAHSRSLSSSLSPLPSPRNSITSPPTPSNNTSIGRPRTQVASVLKAYINSTTSTSSSTSSTAALTTSAQKTSRSISGLTSSLTTPSLLSSPSTPGMSKSRASLSASPGERRSISTPSVKTGTSLSPSQLPSASSSVVLGAANKNRDASTTNNSRPNPRRATTGGINKNVAGGPPTGTSGVSINNAKGSNLGGDQQDSTVTCTQQ